MPALKAPPFLGSALAPFDQSISAAGSATPAARALAINARRESLERCPMSLNSGCIELEIVGFTAFPPLALRSRLVWHVRSWKVAAGNASIWNDLIWDVTG